VPVVEDDRRVVLPALAAYLDGGFVDASDHVRVGHDAAVAED